MGVSLCGRETGSMGVEQVGNRQTRQLLKVCRATYIRVPLIAKVTSHTEKINLDYKLNAKITPRSHRVEAKVDHLRRCGGPT